MACKRQVYCNRVCVEEVVVFARGITIPQLTLIFSSPTVAWFLNHRSPFRANSCDGRSQFFCGAVWFFYIINPGLKPGAIHVAALRGCKKETELVVWRGFYNYDKRKLVMRRIINENNNKYTFVYTAKGVYIGEGLYRVYTSYAAA